MLRAVVAEGSLTFEPMRDWPHPGEVAYPEVEAVARDLLDVDPLGAATPIEIHRLVFELAGRAPHALRSLCEPLGAMLHRVGLATHREQVGLPTTDWDRHEFREEAIHWAERELQRDDMDRFDHGSDRWLDAPGDLMMDDVLLDQPA